MIGELLGFTLGSIHSSRFNMVRSGKGLSKKDLYGKFLDSTETITNSDITMYYGTFFQKREWTLQVSFVDLEEDKLKEIKLLWNDSELLPLIFDETPYKYYMVKVEKITTFKQLSFERNGKRYYNGEGTLNFTSYFPYALSRFEGLEDPAIPLMPTELRNYWEELGYIPHKKNVLPVLGETGYNDSSMSVVMSNPGDLPAIVRIWMNLVIPEHQVDGLTLLEQEFKFNLDVTTMHNGTATTMKLVNVMLGNADDKTLCIDCFRGTIAGYNLNKTQNLGRLYNAMLASDFIVIPPGQPTCVTFKLSNGVIYDSNGNPDTTKTLTLDHLNITYDILYIYRD